MSKLREFMGDEAYRAAVGMLEALQRERSAVDGLVVEVPCAVIRERLVKQAAKQDKLAAFHKSKREAMEQTLGDGLEDFDEDELNNAGVSREGRRHRDRAKSARDKARWCRFVAKYLVDGATYRLKSSDLYRLGLSDEADL